MVFGLDLYPILYYVTYVEVVGFVIMEEIREAEGTDLEHFFSN